MSAETILTASRRLLRFFRIDMKKGGLIVDETLHALELLEAQIRAGKPCVAELREAAKCAVRDLRLDTSDHGGMVSIPTEISFDTLDKALRNVSGDRGEAA